MFLPPLRPFPLRPLLSFHFAIISRMGENVRGENVFNDYV